jgi:uncharacterized metal-binding protein
MLVSLLALLRHRTLLSDFLVGNVVALVFMAMMADDMSTTLGVASISPRHSHPAIRWVSA